jgi:Txe/YoeB family toxin of Txe-Axe toxin-antitoxin module
VPKIIPSQKFLEDLEKFRSTPSMRKKIANTLVHLENDPLHPGLHLERISNDPSAWSIRVDRKYRISIEPQKHLTEGTPDWTAPVILLRFLTHDDLYRFPR